jgi:hypothetical protein
MQILTTKPRKAQENPTNAQIVSWRFCLHKTTMDYQSDHAGPLIVLEKALSMIPKPSKWSE